MQRTLQLLLTLCLVAVPVLARDSTRLDPLRQPEEPPFEEPSFFAYIISSPLLCALALIAAALLVFLVWFVWRSRKVTARFKRTFGFPPMPRYHYKADAVREKLATLSGDELQRTEELAGICGYEDCTSIGRYKPHG